MAQPRRPGRSSRNHRSNRSQWCRRADRSQWVRGNIRVFRTGDSRPDCHRSQRLSPIIRLPRGSAHAPSWGDRRHGPGTSASEGRNLHRHHVAVDNADSTPPRRNRRNGNPLRRFHSGVHMSSRNTFFSPPACQFQPVVLGRPRLPLKTPATSVSPLAADSLGRSSLPPRWASPPRNHHWFIRSAARHRTPKRLGRRPDPEPEQPSPEPHVDTSTIRRVAPPREAYTVRRIRRSLSHRHWDHRSGSWDRDEP